LQTERQLNTINDNVLVDGVVNLGFCNEIDQECFSRDPLGLEITSALPPPELNNEQENLFDTVMRNDYDDNNAFDGDINDNLCYESGMQQQQLDSVVQDMDLNVSFF
jgi:hypothetical protein